MDRINGTMKSEQLVGVFDGYLAPNLHRVATESSLATRADIIFQQDNDPKYKSSTNKNWLSSKGITTMK